MSISVCEALGNEKVLQKVPKDAKEDWSLCVKPWSKFTKLPQTHPLLLLWKRAIGGWYQLYLRATYENWPRREEDLESLVDFASKHETLAEMLSQLVY